MPLHGSRGAHGVAAASDLPGDGKSGGSTAGAAGRAEMPPPPASQKEPLPPQDQRHPPQQAQLRVLTGVHGTDKVYCLPAVGAATATVVFFVGDQLEAKGLPPRVLQLQVRFWLMILVQIVTYFCLLVGEAATAASPVNPAAQAPPISARSQNLEFDDF